MAKAPKDPRNLPTARQLAESGYRGFNEDVGPPVDNPTAVNVGGAQPELPTATKPPKKAPAKAPAK